MRSARYLPRTRSVCGPDLRTRSVLVRLSSRARVGLHGILEFPYATAEGVEVNASSARGFGVDLIRALGRYLRNRTALSRDRKSSRLNSSHVAISYAVFCLKKKTDKELGRAECE